MYKDLRGDYINNKMDAVRINQANIRVSSNACVGQKSLGRGEISKGYDRLRLVSHQILVL
jgi:hypothetical protein